MYSPFASPKAGQIHEVSRSGPQTWNIALNVEQHKHAADKKSPLKGFLVCCICKFDQPFLGAKAFSLREWRYMNQC
jgi:hypothetical protein